MKISEMIAGLPKRCAIGVKKSSDGNQQFWRGYKLHLDIADGQIPITALLTSADVHDARGAIPLMTTTSKRVTYLYGVMDSPYDANAILEHIEEQGRTPVVDIHPRRGAKQPTAVPKVRKPKPAPEMDPAKQQRYKERPAEGQVRRQAHPRTRRREADGASNVRDYRNNTRPIHANDKELTASIYTN